MRASLRLTGGLLVTLLLAACGPQSAQPSSTGGHPTATPRTTPAYRIDETGQVSCTADTPRRPHRGSVEFTAALDGLSARLTGDVTGDRWMPEWHRPRLALTDSNVSTDSWTIDLPPFPQAFRHRYYASGIPFGDAEPLLCLVRFAPGERPLALTAVYAGGAHCCIDLRLYDLGNHGEVVLHAMNYPAKIQLLGGRPYLVHGDNAFSYQFSSFADSCPPVQVFRPEGDGLRDVTTKFPGLLRADAERWWHYAQVRHREPLGFYACWAADEERLGNDGLVWSTLDELAASGALRQRYDPDIDGADFAPALRKFLAEHGYLAG